MQVAQSPYSTVSYVRGNKRTAIQKFIGWCGTQEKNRLLWLAAIIMIHGTLLTPLTLLLITSTGTSILYIALATAAMAMCLIVNLAALPTKITVPVFFLSIIIDLVVMSACIAQIL